MFNSSDFSNNFTFPETAGFAKVDITGDTMNDILGCVKLALNDTKNYQTWF